MSIFFPFFFDKSERLESFRFFKVQIKYSKTGRNFCVLLLVDVRITKTSTTSTSYCSFWFCNHTQVRVFVNKNTTRDNISQESKDLLEKFELP